MAEEPQALRTHPHPTHHSAGRVGACGQNQPRGSRSPATRPMLKHCKSCRQKLLTHSGKKRSIPFRSSSAHPAHLIWVFLLSLSQCTGKITFVVERGRSASTRSPLSTDVLQASRRQQRNRANTSVFSHAVPLQEPEGSWGEAGRAGGSPLDGWWGWRGLATEQRYTHGGLDGHAVFAAGMCLGSTFQPLTSYQPCLATQPNPNPTQPNPNPTQPNPNPSQRLPTTPPRNSPS